MVLDGGALPRRRPVELPARTARRRLEEAVRAAPAGQPAVLRPHRGRRVRRGPDDRRLPQGDRRTGGPGDRLAVHGGDRLGPSLRPLRRQPSAVHPQHLQAVPVGVAHHRPLRLPRPRHPRQRRRHRLHPVDRTRLEDAPQQQGAAGDPLGAPSRPPQPPPRLPRRPPRPRRHHRLGLQAAAGPRGRRRHRARARQRAGLRDEPCCYQQLAPLPDFDGNRVVLGTWVVEGEAAASASASRPAWSPTGTPASCRTSSSDRRPRRRSGRRALPHRGHPPRRSGPPGNLARGP